LTGRLAVTTKRLVAIVAFVGVVSFSGVWGAAAAEREETKLADASVAVVPMAPMSTYEPAVKRPAILPALYVALGAMQAWDVYSTRAALNAGAREANPTAMAFSGNAGSLLGLKAATTASTIFFAERMWKKNKVGAVVMLAAIKGATAAVSMHNMRNARALSTR
jgi:hypothetical protein